jgi:hypothetical protein
MADPVKAEGLVIAYTVGANIYPLACAKDASMTITRDMLELAPKTNNSFREFIPGKRASTITGSGLVKIVGTTQHGIDFFEDLLTTVDTKYTAYLDIIDPQNNYRVYQFQCYVTEVSYDSTVNNFAQYNYSLQVTGGFTELTVVDTYTVASGTITGRSTSTHKLVAVGYGGKWYYNYTVSAGPVITLGTALNGTSVVAAYITL